MHVFYLFSVMEKLPATSYVRLVDIWLIFGQLMPFIQVSTVCVVFMLLGIKFTKYITKVTLTTIVELYNEGDDIVNHHGFQRQVKNGKEVQTKNKVSSE